AAKAGTTESIYPPPPPPLEFADPGSSTPEAEEEERNPFNQPSVATLGAGTAPVHHDHLLLEHEDDHDYGERPKYRDQGFGQGLPAIVEDGIPRYIPALPVVVEEGIRGRRICGLAWAIFGVILGLVVYNAGIFS